jgi:hypothetical protein
MRQAVEQIVEEGVAGPDPSNALASLLAMIA